MLAFDDRFGRVGQNKITILLTRLAGERNDAFAHVALNKIADDRFIFQVLQINGCFYPFYRDKLPEPRPSSSSGRKGAKRRADERG